MKICTLLLTASLAVAAIGSEQPHYGSGLAGVLRQLGVKTPVDELEPAPIPGFFEVVRGLRVLYVSDDGRMLIDGDILSIDTETNLTDAARRRIRLQLISAVPEAQRIVVPAAGATRARIAVFADTDCPYCLKLHRQADAFANAGIEVQYLLYPRAGIEGDTWRQAEAVWCAPDRDAALEAVLGGEVLPAADCDNPVRLHYALAESLELKGTPAIVTESGRVIYGVVAAEEILAERR